MIDGKIIKSDGTRTVQDYDGATVTLEKGWYYLTSIDWSGPYDTKDQAQIEFNQYAKFLDSDPKVMTD